MDYKQEYSRQTGKNMGKHEKYPEPKLYEWLDTEFRFTSLADAILDRQGKDVQLSHPYAAPKKVAYWTTSNNIFEYRLEKKDLGEFGGRHYLLEQFEVNKHKDRIATARFLVEVWRDGSTPLEKIDSKDLPINLDPLERKTAIRHALSILTTIARGDAEKILNQTIERRFPLIAATYILSDMAIERPGAPSTIDRSVITLKSMDFLKQMLDMESYITKLSVDDEGDVDLNHFNHLANPPQPDLFNGFKEVDLRPALETVVDEVGPSWHNTISRSHHDFI